MAFGIGQVSAARGVGGFLTSAQAEVMRCARLLFLLVAPFLFVPSALFGNGGDFEIKAMETPFDHSITTCVPEQFAEIEKSLSVDPTPNVIVDPVGSLFTAQTQHGVFGLVSENSVSGVVIFFRSDMTPCSTYFIFEAPVSKNKFRLEAAFKIGRFLSSASGSEVLAYESFIDACNAAGDDAINRFTGRDYELGDGQVLGADGAFDCQVSLGFNSSSTRIIFGKHKARITVIGDQVVVVEE